MVNDLLRVDMIGSYYAALQCTLADVHKCVDDCSHVPDICLKALDTCIEADNCQEPFIKILPNHTLTTLYNEHCCDTTSNFCTMLPQIYVKYRQFCT